MVQEGHKNFCISLNINRVGKAKELMRLKNLENFSGVIDTLIYRWLERNNCLDEKKE